jgi:hypothetical protein
VTDVDGVGLAVTDAEAVGLGVTVVVIVDVGVAVAEGVEVRVGVGVTCCATLTSSGSVRALRTSSPKKAHTSTRRPIMRRAECHRGYGAV